MSVREYPPTITAATDWNNLIKFITGSGVFTPQANNAIDIGTASLQFKNAYFTGSLSVSGSSTFVGGLTVGGSVHIDSQILWANDIRNNGNNIVLLRGNTQTQGVGLQFNTAGVSPGFADSTRMTIASGYAAGSGSIIMYDPLTLSGVGSNIVPTINNADDIGAVNAQFKNGYFTGSLYVSGSLNAGGITYTSFQSAGITGSSLIAPSANNTVDLGTPTKQFKNEYITGSLYVSGSIVCPNLSLTASGSMSPATYTIYSGSGHYYAKNANGSIIYDETDFKTLINEVEVATNAVGGGLVFIKGGEYSMASQATLLSNVSLRGEGKVTHIYLPPGQAQTSATYTIFRGDSVSNFFIRDMCFDGNYANNVGAGFESMRGCVFIAGNSYNIDLENLDVINMSRDGIVVYVEGGQTAYNINTRNCRLDWGGTWNSIYYLCYGGSTIKGCSITDNDVSHFSDIGICLGQTVGGTIEKINIVNNRVYDGVDGYGSSTPPSIYGIKIEGVIYDCIIAENQIWQVWRGICDDGGSLRCSIIGNTVRSDLAGAGASIQIFWWGGNYNKIINNNIFSGYVSWQPAIDITGDYNTVEGNTVTKAGAGDGFVGLWIESTAASTMVHGNRFVACDTDIDDDSGTTKKRDNISSAHAWITDV